MAERFKIGDFVVVEKRTLKGKGGPRLINDVITTYHVDGVGYRTAAELRRATVKEIAKVRNRRG